MIQLQNVSLQRGPKPLFDNVDLTIHAGQKVGINGANGTGKSSLFALLRGELSSETGHLFLPTSWTIAHVAQEMVADAASALDFVIDGDRELRTLEQAARSAEAADDGDRLAQIHAQLDAIGGYTARTRAETLLSGLGFAKGDGTRPVADFSGGWRMRLNLAQSLMCRSDLLLLDEPTNHLDLDTVFWLEQWLKGYQGTLLLISHDRDFLDSVVDSIAYVEGRGITLYRGNYSACERQRAERLALQQAQHEKQQREAAALQRFIDRFRAKATKARQAQSRLKTLERMEMVAAVRVESPFRFSFPEPESAPHPLITCKELSLGYPERTVLDDVALTLEPGSRVALLGPNGAGKSTLIRFLAGELEARSGRVVRGEGLKVGYFAQHQLEYLDLEASPLVHLQRLSPDAREQSLRDFLGGFAFHGDRAVEPVGPLSGGEKARLALAILVWQRPNLLLLDEPTNHLDLAMRDALSFALQDYAGAVVLVSHDRHLLKATADDLLLVVDGGVSPFTGDLEDYRRWLSERAHQGPSGASPGQGPAPVSADRKTERRAAAQRRAELKPLRDRLKSVERNMDQLQQEQGLIEARLADPAAYEATNRDRLQADLARQGELRRQIEALEEQWLELADSLEQAQAG